MAQATAPTTEPDADEEVETPEVVDPPAERAVAVREETDSERRANEAIVAASDAAINMPGVPGRDEFLALAMQARVLSMSGAAPKLVRDNPHLAFHIAMVGRDLGISPSAALELIDVIDGRNGPQLSLSPQLINGQIRRLGLGSIIPVIKSDQRCVAVAMGPGGFYDPRCKREWPDHHELCTCKIETFLGETEFTWTQAQTAELAGRDCEPGKHSNGCKNWTKGMSCNQGYRTYPQRMMWWRAAGFLADDIFPEASLGLYSPEALGAVVDADGRPIDPTTVALPEGYEPAELPPPPPPKPTAPTAAEDILDDLRVRVAALPDAQRATYREKWMESQRLQGFTLANLPEDRLTLATSMLKGFEKIAEREGWDPAAARAEVLARREESPGEGEDPPQEPASAPEPPDGDKDPEGASEATSDDPGPDGDPSEPTPAERRAPDPEIAAWVRELGAIADEAEPGLVASIVAEVKALHHANVDRELTDHGVNTAGRHIDERRMILTASRVERHLHPEACKMLRCTEDAGVDGTCPGHTPF
jgi:hypothetical protein